MKQKYFLALAIFGMVIVSGCINASGDPFGAPPKRIGTALNCGQDDRYKFDVLIESKEDFVNFIKNNKISYWVELDNFRDGNPVDGEINWNNVLEAVKIEKIGNRTIYVLDYNLHTCSGSTLKMTDDGHVSVRVGCCGK